MRTLFSPVLVWEDKNGKLYGSPVAAPFKSQENAKKFLETFDSESMLPGYEEGNREATWNEEGYLTTGKTVVPWYPIRYDVVYGIHRDQYAPVEYGIGEHGARRAREEAETSAAKARRYGIDAVVVEEILDVNISD